MVVVIAEMIAKSSWGKLVVVSVVVAAGGCVDCGGCYSRNDC